MSSSPESIRFLQKQLEKCFDTNCIEKTFRKCVLCKRPVCPKHQSKDDADYCIDCMSDGKMDIKVEKLLDADGAHPAGGRHLIPIGEHYVTFPTYVSRMDSVKLDACIEEYARLVHEAVAVVDQRRVKLSILQSEKSDRDEINRKTKRQPSFTLSTPSGERVRVGAANSKDDRAKQLMAQFTKLGVTPDKLATMLQQFMAQKGIKK